MSSNPLLCAAAGACSGAGGCGRDRRRRQELPALCDPQRHLVSGGSRAPPSPPPPPPPPLYPFLRSATRLSSERAEPVPHQPRPPLHLHFLMALLLLLLLRLLLLLPGAAERLRAPRGPRRLLPAAALDHERLPAEQHPLRARVRGALVRVDLRAPRSTPILAWQQQHPLLFSPFA